MKCRRVNIVYNMLKTSHVNKVKIIKISCIFPQKVVNTHNNFKKRVIECTEEKLKSAE